MTTKHTHQMVFGRREAGCPRCAELNAGAQPVEWAATRRAREERETVAEIRSHKCAASGCGPVCTAFDW